jgi:hypothetical protein
MRMEECSIHGNFITVEQNFTFVAGSSFVGKGAPGQIALWDGHCFDVLTKTSNGVSIDYLAPLPCNGYAMTIQFYEDEPSYIDHSCRKNRFWVLSQGSAISNLIGKQAHL